jgi:putative aminopeptidase FrvX
MAEPTLGIPQLKLLERLCNAVAVSGEEGEVRAIVLDEIRAHVEDVRVDALGNVLATRSGSGRNRPRVMLAAHMDEVGFMLVNADGDGLFQFETVGSIDVRQLPGKRVWVGKGHLPGVIGARPIHLTTAEERERKIPLESLRIDLGPKVGLAQPGERAAFATSFRRVGPSLLAKALDNRLGVATLIELIKHAPPNIDLLAAFTVQEEIGLRGAFVAAHALKPDLALVLDSTPANDLPMYDDSENHFYNTRLDAGPAIYTADGGMVHDVRLVRFLAETAQAAKIPFQYRQPGGGQTDAAAIQRSLTGILAVSVSVPGRYAHTACSLCRLDDWKNTLRLLYTALQQVTPALLKQQ